VLEYTRITPTQNKALLKDNEEVRQNSATNNTLAPGASYIAPTCTGLNLPELHVSTPQVSTDDSGCVLPTSVPQNINDTMRMEDQQKTNQQAITFASTSLSEKVDEEVLPECDPVATGLKYQMTLEAVKGNDQCLSEKISSTHQSVTDPRLKSIILTDSNTTANGSVGDLVSQDDMKQSFMTDPKNTTTNSACNPIERKVPNTDSGIAEQVYMQITSKQHASEPPYKQLDIVQKQDMSKTEAAGAASCTKGNFSLLSQIPIDDHSITEFSQPTIIKADLPQESNPLANNVCQENVTNIQVPSGCENINVKPVVEMNNSRPLISSGSTETQTMVSDLTYTCIPVEDSVPENLFLNHYEINMSEDQQHTSEMYVCNIDGSAMQFEETSTVMDNTVSTEETIIKPSSAQDEDQHVGCRIEAQNRITESTETAEEEVSCCESGMVAQLVPTHFTSKQEPRISEQKMIQTQYKSDHKGTSDPSTKDKFCTLSQTSNKEPTINELTKVSSLPKLPQEYNVLDDPICQETISILEVSQLQGFKKPNSNIVPFSSSAIENSYPTAVSDLFATGVRVQVQDKTFNKNLEIEQHQNIAGEHVEATFVHFEGTTVPVPHEPICQNMVVQASSSNEYQNVKSVIVEDRPQVFSVQIEKTPQTMVSGSAQDEVGNKHPAKNHKNTNDVIRCMDSNKIDPSNITTTLAREETIFSSFKQALPGNQKSDVASAPATIQHESQVDILEQDKLNKCATKECVRGKVEIAPPEGVATNSETGTEQRSIHLSKPKEPKWNSCHSSCAMMKSLSANSSRRNSAAKDADTGVKSFNDLLQERRKLLTSHHQRSPSVDEVQPSQPDWMLKRAAIINKADQVEEQQFKSGETVQPEISVAHNIFDDSTHKCPVDIVKIEGKTQKSKHMATHCNNETETRGLPQESSVSQDSVVAYHSSQFDDETEAKALSGENNWVGTVQYSPVEQESYVVRHSLDDYSSELAIAIKEQADKTESGRSSPMTKDAQSSWKIWSNSTDNKEVDRSETRYTALYKPGLN
jgi:hypothetical protein